MMNGDPLSPENLDEFLGITPEGRERFERHEFAPAVSGGRTCVRCGATITLDTINDAPAACLTVV